MMTSARVAALTFALMLLAGAFVLGRASTARPPEKQAEHALVSTAESSPSAQRIPVSARELGLQLQVQSLEARLSRLEGEGRPAATSHTEATEAVAVRSAARAPKTPAEYEAARRSALEASEQRFHAANGTSEWSRQRTASYVSLEPKTGTVQSIDCRAEICRLEVGHDTPQDAERFVDEIGLDPRFANQSIRWFFANPERTRRVLFIEPAKQPTARR